MLFTLIAVSMVSFLSPEVTAQEVQEKKPATNTFTFSLTLGFQGLKVDAKLETEQPPVQPKPIDDATEDQLLETYYIGDLVVPIDEKKKLSLYETGEFDISDQDRAAVTSKDFNPIIDLITSTIDSESWEGPDAGSISPYAQNLSLVIAQTKPTHQKIQSLIRKLRELNDVMIKLDSHLVIVDESSSLSGESFDATSIKNYKSLIQVVADNASVSSAFPAAVLFNGEGNTFPSSDATESKLGPLCLQAVVTRDLKSVKLRCSNKEPVIATGPATALSNAVTPNENAKPEVTATVSQVVEIANEGYVSIDVTPMLENNSKNQKAILFVRPTISDQRKK